MMGLGARAGLFGECHSLGYDRVQQAQTKIAHLADVTGRRDCKTLSLAFNVSFCVNLPLRHRQLKPPPLAKRS